MEFEFLQRVRKTSLIFGLILAVMITTYMGVDFGVGWLIGTAWSLINLHFIGQLIKRSITLEKRNQFKIALIFAVKFPVLYLIGFLLLKSGRFHVTGMLAGFTWPLLVITLKALGRLILKMDDRGPVRLGKHSKLLTKD